MVRLTSAANRAVNAIAADRTSGAVRLSRRALAVLRLVASESSAGSPTELLQELRATALALSSAHPSMVPMLNQVAHTLSIFQHQAPNLKTIEEACAFLHRTTLRLSLFQARAARKLAVQAPRLIGPGDSIGTASFSETFIRLCKAARADGKPFRVLAAESAFQDRSYGALTTARLQAEGIQSVQVADLQLDDGMGAARRFIVGADAVLPDGSIINGSPSLALAVLAFQKGLPFYAVCDSTKVSPTVDIKLENGFDLLPGGLITALLTEDGPLTHQELTRLAARAARWSRVLYKDA